jgi:hypothetical protein
MTVDIPASTVLIIVLGQLVLGAFALWLRERR